MIGFRCIFKTLVVDMFILMLRGAVLSDSRDNCQSLTLINDFLQVL